MINFVIKKKIDNLYNVNIFDNYAFSSLCFNCAAEGYISGGN